MTQDSVGRVFFFFCIMSSVALKVSCASERHRETVKGLLGRSNVFILYWERRALCIINGTENSTYYSLTVCVMSILGPRPIYIHFNVNRLKCTIFNKSQSFLKLSFTNLFCKVITMINFILGKKKALILSHLVTFRPSVIKHVPINHPLKTANRIFLYFNVTLRSDTFNCYWCFMQMCIYIYI